jgi:hypothetical protein
MGNHFTSLPAPAPVDLRLLVQVEHPQLLFQDTIGKGRFFKAVSARFVPRDSATGRLAPGESAISMEGRVLLKVLLPRERTAASQRRLREAGEQLAEPSNGGWRGAPPTRRSPTCPPPPPTPSHCERRLLLQSSAAGRRRGARRGRRRGAQRHRACRRLARWLTNITRGSPLGVIEDPFI